MLSEVRDSCASPSPMLDSEPGGAALKTLCGILSGLRVEGLDSADWSRVAYAAEGHGVAPLLCRFLDDGGWPKELTIQVRKSLRRAYFSTAAKNLFIYGELRRILDAFAERVPVVVLKGADLALSAYPSLALRPMADLDLLVEPSRWDVALGALQGQGYRRVVPDITPGHRRSTAHDVCLLGGPCDSVLVELHWGLVASDQDRRSPSLDWFWRQVETLDCRQVATEDSESEGGSRVGLPASFHHFKPTANLLYLAAHIGVQHGMTRSKLLWFYDLHLLVEGFGDSIDWEETLEKADELEWSGALAGAVGRTREYFGTNFPVGFLEALAERRHEREENKPGRKGSATKGSRLWRDMMCLSWVGRLRFVRGHVFPTPTYMRWRYKLRPTWLWPLTYPYRWWAICSEAVSALRYWARKNAHPRSERDNRVARALKEVAAERPLRLKVNGDCMAPLARHGESVEITQGGILLPGDVIALRQNGQLKLHRLIGYRPYLNRLGLVTQGDHNSSCDMHSDFRDVIGRVSGGECSPMLISVPLRHRLWALGRFMKLVCERIARAVSRA